jgi:hypothetical protein
MITVPTDYVFFKTKNYTNTFSTTGYALDICPFTFIPLLDNNPQYSSNRVLWDFGDGTQSRSLCASHTYTFPGTYNVTLYLYATGGEAVLDSFQQHVTVKNFITDSISLSSKSNFIQEAGSIGHAEGITVIRYNSWQTFQALSSTGYTINLVASGANCSYLDIDKYNSDKYAHLDNSNKFYIKELSPVTNTYIIYPINSVQTPSTNLYAKISGSDVVLCSYGEPGSTFAGTYGTKRIYFSGDVPTVGGEWFKLRSPVIVFASFDTSQFEDALSHNKGYYTAGKRSEFPVLNHLPATAGIIITPPASVDNLTFSSNGIDGIEDIDQPFSIYPTQYENTKIPVVIKIKTPDNNSASFFPRLTSANSAGIYEINIQALTGAGDALSLERQPTIVSDMDVVSGTGGGFWKGYVYFSDIGSTLSDVFLSAAVVVDESYNYVQHPTTIGAFGDTGNNNIFKTTISQKYKFDSSGYQIIEGAADSEYIYAQTTSLSNQTSFQIIPEENEETGSYASIWSADASAGVLTKYNTFGIILSSINLNYAVLSGGNTLTVSNSGAEPHYIAADGNKNIWSTIYSHVSTVKINSTTGKIDCVAYPALSSRVYTHSATYSAYPALSAYIGKNTILPTAVDTLSDNKIWVSYTHPLSNIIVKYSSSGVVENVIYLSAGYIPVDLVTTSTDSMWAVLQQTFTSNTSPSGFNDLIIRYDGALSAVYQSQGRLHNITIDTSDNVYVTNHKLGVIKVDALSLTATEFELPESFVSNLSANIDSLELTAIGGTGGDNVAVINSIQNNITFIDSLTGGISSPSYITRGSTGTLIARGDWTGLRWINKYSPRTLNLSGTIAGQSSPFTVYVNDDRYKIGKINEDFDATEMYKNLRYQEALLDDTNMFDGFIGTIVGNLSSSPNTLGKRVYERAANFVSNINDPDTCNVDALYSLCQLYGEDAGQFEQFRFTSPANLKRLIDLISIKQSKLWGTRNKFDKDFDAGGYEAGGNEYYGTNLGAELDVATCILTAGEGSAPIVAYSKFSGRYHYINTDILSSQHVEFLTSNTYALSSYNTNWEWPLVVPEGTLGDGVVQYYKFFNYVPGATNTLVDYIINWDDVTTTLVESASSYNSWIGKNQAAENIISYALYAGLNLFDNT